MLLPNRDNAVISLEKLQDYCLNPEHPEGRHKAYLFEKLLGISRRDWQQLHSILIDAARKDGVVAQRPSAHGITYYLETQVSRNQRVLTLRSLWLIPTDEIIPRFVSCYLKRKSDGVTD